MAYQVLFGALAFQRTDPENPTVPVGNPVVVEKGGMVPEWVTPFLINALASAGMIVEVGDQPREDLTRVADVPPQPRTPDQPVVLPSDPNGVPPAVEGQGDPSLVPLDDDPADTEEPPARPSRSDSKAAWEAYASEGLPEGQRIPLAEAETMTKNNLIAEVERREQAA